MAKERGRKPAFKLSVMRRDNGKHGVVGAAWREDDGSISIMLNPCVTLSGDADVFIKLFPVDPDWKPASRSREESEPEGQAEQGRDDADPPFT